MADKLAQMLNVGGNLPPEILQQQQALNRQQQMAQLLMQQGMNQPQGQMVSGRYVAPSFFQYATPLLQGYVGTKIAEKAEKSLADLLRQQQEGKAQTEEQIVSAITGKPAEITEMAGPYTGKVPMPIAVQPPVPPNVAEATRLIRTNPYGAGKEFLPQIAKTLLPETPTSFKEYELAQKYPQYAQMLQEKQKGVNVAVNLGQKGFDNTLKLRSDFRSEPVYKGFQEIESAYGQINKGLDAKSPAGDLAAATKFMKLLDPTSVVRESELSMAMAATGALDKLYNYANLITTGQKLTPSQRDDFRKLSNEFYSTAYGQYNTKRDEYVGIAKRNELNIEDVVGKEPKAPNKMMSAQDQQALNWANANPNDPRAAQIKQRLGM